jgi:hypothetical protein
MLSQCSLTEFPKIVTVHKIGALNVREPSKNFLNCSMSICFIRKKTLQTLKMREEMLIKFNLETIQNSNFNRIVDCIQQGETALTRKKLNKYHEEINLKKKYDHNSQ